jgi:hypothetical protein
MGFAASFGRDYGNGAVVAACATMAVALVGP